MPRGASKYNEEAQKTTTSPIILVRLIDMPHRIDGSKHSLYLTDCEHDVIHFDEKGIPMHLLKLWINLFASHGF